MRIITAGTLSRYAKTYPDAAPALRAWLRLARAGDWANLAEMRRTFPHADPFGCCTIFNVRGNHYRLITHVDYAFRLVFLRHFLTHPEYDEEDWKRDC